ncbi:MAG: hypothetical protein C5B51_03910 [Terriglobia bacterium]|nr:MAG: hypothetical protein C5B51_03910 [Terriglobia bacterium]
MRYLGRFLAILPFTGFLFGADPFVGVWKLDNAKSLFRQGSSPKDQALIITARGGALDVTVKGTSADGGRLFCHYVAPAAGGPGKIIESSYDGISTQRIGPFRRAVSYMKNGKVVFSARSQVALDEATITVILNGTDMQGRSIDAIAVYFKQ